MGFFSELDIDIKEFVLNENPTKEQVRARYPLLTDDEIENYLEMNFDDDTVFE